MYASNFVCSEQGTAIEIISWVFSALGSNRVIRVSLEPQKVDQLILLQKLSILIEESLRQSGDWLSLDFVRAEGFVRIYPAGDMDTIEFFRGRGLAVFFECHFVVFKFRVALDEPSSEDRMDIVFEKTI